ncbi:MAG TPA: hypothetical protein VGO35_11060 [Gammaproteobacteria bacterium]|jgi:hypothetical protein|nr:hypothetical protein [Gammaproteobacteria bacterium]
MESSAGSAKFGSPAVVLIASAVLTVLMMAPLSSRAQDLGVCDAYLQLLKQTKFEKTPFCGRPEDGSVPGFIPLKRNYWEAEQIWPIFTHVYEFMLFDDQLHVQRFFSQNPDDPNKPLVTTDPTRKDGIAQFLHRGWMSVWSYAEPIDIENDGSPLNLLLWQGYGATGLSGGGGPCGSDYAEHSWTISYVNQQAFIVNLDGKTIDEQLTRKIFGAPEESSLRHPKYIPGVAYDANPFRPLAGSIGIFEYRDRYYIETENMPKTKDAPLPPVVVYLREHGHTTRICSLRLENEPVPEDD